MIISQILRTYGKQFKQIAQQYSDGHNGRCALGVIMSYYGWNGKDDSQVTRKLLSTLIALSYAGIDKSLLAELNDSGVPFDEIADHLDKCGGSQVSVINRPSLLLHFIFYSNISRQFY